MGLSRTGLAIVGVLVASAALANKPNIVPTPENMAGAWRAVVWNDHCRILIDAHGQGHFARTASSGEVRAYRIITTTYSRYEVRMHLESPGKEHDPFVLVGEGNPSLIMFRSKDFFGKQEVRFDRETEWRLKEDALSSWTPEP